MEEDNKNNDDLLLFKIGNITDRRNLINLKLSDRENYTDKSHRTQNPEDAFFPNTNNYNYYNFKGNDSKLSLETFKTMFKNKNKELKEYKDALDKKIEILRNKIINSKKNSNNISKKTNSLDNIGNIGIINKRKGRNQENKDSSLDKINLPSTINENNEENTYNIINEKQSKKNFDESVSYSLKKENKISNPEEYPIFDLEKEKTIFINYDLFNNTFYKNKFREKNFYTLLSLLNNNDIYKLLKINRSTRNSIIGLLRNKIKENIYPKFIKKYCNDSLFAKNSDSFSIILKSYKKNKRAFIRIILSIKAKIFENKNSIINKKHQILYQILNSDNLENSTYTSYSFEVIPKPIPKKFWIYKEYTSYHYDDFDKVYYNDLLQFWPGDEVQISIGLINELGILDFQNFHWLSPKVIPKINKDKISDILIDSYLTNSENTCEVEGIINSWIGIEQLENNVNVIDTLKQLFGNHFFVKEVYYEDIGYYFFKIILEAKKEGECGGINNNLGIKLIIYDKNKHICNEIKKNGLIYDEHNNELKINIDDVITFYISQNK